MSAREMARLECSRRGFDYEDVVGPKRMSSIVLQRTAVAKALRGYGFSLNDIGHALGGRHHASIIWLLDRDGKKVRRAKRFIAENGLGL